MLKQYEKIGSRSFELEELRDLLQIPVKYKYADIKRKILSIAEGEINTLTDIYIKFEEIKPSRAVTGLNFTICKNFETSEDNKPFLKWVNLMRKTYINQEIIFYPSVNANVRINSKGMLYLDNGVSIKPDKAKVFWEWAYKNQGKLLTPSLGL
jgi:plasmid replication initiation protein